MCLSRQTSTSLIFGRALSSEFSQNTKITQPNGNDKPQQTQVANVLN